MLDLGFNCEFYKATVFDFKLSATQGYSVFQHDAI